MLFTETIAVIRRQHEARGGAVVEALRYKPEGCGLIPDGVTGSFQRHNPRLLYFTLCHTMNMNLMFIVPYILVTCFIQGPTGCTF
jgi:hypothetical protein